MNETMKQAALRTIARLQKMDKQAFRAKMKEHSDGDIARSFIELGDIMSLESESEQSPDLSSMIERKLEVKVISHASYENSSFPSLRGSDLYLMGNELFFKYTSSDEYRTAKNNEFSVKTDCSIAA